jgi:hypothetical protein
MNPSTLMVGDFLRAWRQRRRLSQRRPSGHHLSVQTISDTRDAIGDASDGGFP